MICAAGIKEVYYAEEYDRFTNSELVNEYCKKNNIKIQKIDMNGNLV